MFIGSALFDLMITSGESAEAGSLEGILQGQRCMVIAKLYVANRIDPRMVAEKNFVIVDYNGDYYEQ
jgi:hypothetical protein